MATRAIAPAVLLLALLAGCGGAEPDAAKAADPTTGIEEAEAKPAQTSATPPAQPVRRIDESLIPAPGQPIVRETYSYAGGPRDPFESALDIANAGPEFPDLELVAIYYVPPASSVVVLRDRLNGKRYTVREGQRLGRMRVANIRPKDVTFTIDDYGTERQESLSIRKPEGNSP